MGRPVSLLNVALCRILSHPSPLSSAAVFLRAADLISTEYRYRLLATTMIGQVWQRIEGPLVDC